MAKRRQLVLNPNVGLREALKIGAQEILRTAAEDLDEKDADPGAVDYLVQCASRLLHAAVENEVPRG